MSHISRWILGLALVAGGGWCCWQLAVAEHDQPRDTAAVADGMLPAPPEAVPAGEVPPATDSRPVLPQVPRVVMPEPGEIQGVVLDRGGEIPVNHARVTIELYTPRGERNYSLVNSFRQELKVNEEGGFRLQVPGGGWYRVTADAKGFAPKREEKVRPGSKVKLLMDVGAGLSGVVFEKGTRNPVSAVKVTGRPEDGGPEREAETDEKGRFFLSELPAGTFLLSFLHADYVHKKDFEQEVILGGRHRIEVELETGKRIKGSVLSARDQYPIAGAIIKVGAKEVKSDDSGRFLMRGVAAEALKVEVAARGFSAHTRSLNLSGSREEAEIEVLLTAGAEITGEVRDGKGKPVVGALIKIYNSHNNGQWMYIDWRYRNLKVKTDKEGRYVLTGLSANRWYTYAIGATHEDYPKSFAKDIKIVNADDRITADITMGDGGLVEGTVTDQDGNPVIGARVTMYSNTAYDWSNQNQLVVGTNDKGVFLYKGISEGKYYLYVNAKGYSTGWKSNIEIVGSSERRGVDITLHRGEPLSGVVVDKESGDPIVGVLVRVRAKGAEGKAVSDGDGKFRVESIPEGPYGVTAKLESYATYNRRNIRPEGDGTLHVELARQPVLKGVVLDDATGKPIKRFQVALTKKNDRRPGSVRAAARRWVKDKEGRFTLQAKKGTYRLEVYAAGYVRFMKKDVKLELDKVIPPMEVRLRKGGGIEGYVRGPGGDPMRSVQVYVRESDDASGLYRRKGYSEYDGYFFVGDLNAVDHDIVLKANGYPLWRQEGVRVGGAFPSSIEADLERLTRLFVRVKWKRKPGLRASNRVQIVSSNGRMFTRYIGRRRTKVTIEALEKQLFHLEGKGYDATRGRSYLLSARRTLNMRNGSRSGQYDLRPGPYRIVAKAPGYPEQVKFVNLDFSTQHSVEFDFKPPPKKKPAAKSASGSR